MRSLKVPPHRDHTARVAGSSVLRVVHPQGPPLRTRCQIRSCTRYRSVRCPSPIQSVVRFVHDSAAGYWLRSAGALLIPHSMSAKPPTRLQRGRERRVVLCTMRNVPGGRGINEYPWAVMPAAEASWPESERFARRRLQHCSRRSVSRLLMSSGWYRLCSRSTFSASPSH
jgi:hypothetical protein